ncbi:DUF1405 domain-containing protein [Cohnella panacarvi]|uniref:DUF1405 domain-containing protein n=1 Tax=Cohnella panacarvi TaxID=400776 RepID=UPI00047B0440|nr:DUF1405 domain-containing protein [Cohnella panacarvi]
MSWLLLQSRTLLLHRKTLWLMMIIYIPGTAYGYYWYKNQLIRTWDDHPMWHIPFVPDSPTASLFFALAVLWLWLQPAHSESAVAGTVRGIVEALGVVTSVKYGIWATVIIFWGQAQGDILVWEHWMLVIGHSAMAVTALLYARFFTFGWVSLIVAAGWTFLNDTIDYTFDVYPSLPWQLDDDLLAVGWFTFLLTAFSVSAAALARFATNEKKLD